jgi:DNA-binding NtrC family response regulator
MLEGHRIVLVEDDEIMGASLVQRLELEGAEVQWHRHVARALPAIRSPRRPVDAVVCDIRLPDGTGEDLYATLCRTLHPPPFLFITGQGGIDQAVRLIRSGAADYIVKPFDMGAFLARLVQVIQPSDSPGLPPSAGISPAARAVDRLVADAAGREGPVLVRGAAGLGKARLARRIHDGSDRRAAPFVVADGMTGDLSPTALDRAAAQAGDGTLVVLGLDRLSAAAQDALMAVLAAPAVRLIATASPGGASLRPDLTALLTAHEIVVPPLADRPEDAVWLAARMFPALNARRARPLSGIAAHADEALRAHDWPGNGREVRARMVRAVEAAAGDMVQPADLFPEWAGEAAIRPLADVRDSAERAQIALALTRTQGQVAEAAKLLRVSRTTLWEKMQKLGL